MAVLKSRSRYYRNPVTEYALFCCVIIFGILITLISLPHEAKWVWPRWPALITLCWITSRDKIKVGVWGWALLGLCMDYVSHTQPGQQMLSYAMLGWINIHWRASSSRTNEWITVIPRIWILMMILEITQLCSGWILTGSGSAYFLSYTLVGALLSPILCVLFSNNKRY